MSKVRLITYVFVVLFSFTTPIFADPSTNTILVEGIKIQGGVNGMVFDSEDNFYVSSVWGHKIYKLDPNTGEILDIFDSNDGILWPEEIAIGPDNSIYWTSVVMGEVGKLSPDRLSVTHQFVTPFINSIAFSHDGRLAAAADLFSSGLYELALELNSPPRLIDENVASSSLTFGSNNLLYGTVIWGEQLISVDIDTGVTNTVVDSMTLPGSVKFDNLGNLYVSDIALGEIFLVDEQTNTSTFFADLGIGGNRFAFDSNNRLFFSNTLTGNISEMNPDGTSREVLAGGLVAPNGISVFTKGTNTSIFVGNIQTLLEFDTHTGETLSEEFNILTEQGITSPMTVSADGDNLVLASWLFPTVQVWNPETKTVIEEYTDFISPVNAIRYQNSLIIADLGEGFTNPQVVMRSAVEDTVLADDTTGLITPLGLVATENNLWVSDWSTGKILQLIRDGVQLVEPLVVVEGLSKPEGLAIDLKGNMLVVETGKQQLSRIKFREGKKPKIKKIAKKLGVGNTVYPSIIPVAPPSYFFSGVAVDDEGVIYVSGDELNVVYRIEPKNKGVAESEDFEYEEFEDNDD